VFVTSEGTTARSAFGKAMDLEGQMRKVPGQRYRRSAVPRLMPESIEAIADGDPDMYLHLLRRFGYLLP
jgi:hypothetical protein